MKALLEIQGLQAWVLLVYLETGLAGAQEAQAQALHLLVLVVVVVEESYLEILGKLVQLGVLDELDFLVF